MNLRLILHKSLFEYIVKKRISFVIIVPVLALFLISWGSTGHKKINRSILYFFNNQILPFSSWVSFLEAHASDADNRKSTDPNEEPKHYIDIDTYQDFIERGYIIQKWDSIITIYGYSNVINEGILPWATVNTYDSLVVAFKAGNWNKAALLASDLGHYVGDGHMPLHLTKNYNGQLTGNTGIHSRYESTMINAYSSSIIYSGDTNLQYISNVNQYVFDYIYNNYKYKDSILIADNFAKNASGGSTTSSTYTLNLWNKTKDFTIYLFREASKSLTNLIYSAWIDAGSPIIGNITSQINESNYNKFNILVYPNPSKSGIFLLNFDNFKSRIEIYVYNTEGKIVEYKNLTDINEKKVSVELKLNNLKNGLYFANIICEGTAETIKLLKY